MSSVRLRHPPRRPPLLGSIPLTVPRKAGFRIGFPGKTARKSDTDTDTDTELPLPPTVAAAHEVLRKFQETSTLADKKVDDSVSGHALQDPTSLASEKWVGTEDEKKAW